MLKEELIDEFTDWRLLGIGDELAVLPTVSERSRTTERLTHFCSNRNRSRNPLRDLLALPLGHRCDHGVEEAAGRRGRVDGFLERNQVGVVLAEPIGEIQKLASITGEAGELRED